MLCWPLGQSHVVETSKNLYESDCWLLGLCLKSLNESVSCVCRGVPNLGVTWRSNRNTTCRTPACCMCKMHSQHAGTPALNSHCPRRLDIAKPQAAPILRPLPTPRSRQDGDDSRIALRAMNQNTRMAFAAAVNPRSKRSISTAQQNERQKPLRLMIETVEGRTRNIGTITSKPSLILEALLAPHD